MIPMLLGLALTIAPAAQDDPAPDLIKKLASEDPDVSENAQRDLLDLGEKAVAPLRAAVTASDDEPFKDVAGTILERLAMRKAAAGVVDLWGERWYAVYQGALKIGWAHLKTEAEGDHVRLTDELTLKTPDNDLTAKLSILCRKNEFLSPLELTVDLDSAENTVSYSATVKEGRVVVRSGGAVNAVKVSPSFSVDFAVLRLVTLAPRTEGYDLQILQTLSQKRPVDATLAFDREESIEHEGRKVKTRRYIISDGEQEDRFYWVDAKGRLLKLQSANEIQIVLSDEKRAKDIDTRDE